MINLLSNFAAQLPIVFPVAAAVAESKSGGELAQFALVLVTGGVVGWFSEFLRSGRATRERIEKMAGEAIAGQMGEFDRRVVELENDTKALGTRMHEHELGSQQRLSALQVSIERNCASKQDLADFRREAKEDNERVRKSIHEIRNTLQVIAASRGGR